MEIKAAAIYMPEIHVGNPTRNIENLGNSIRNCLEQNPGIDIVVAPELANVGYHLIECEYYRKFGKHKTSREIKATAQGRDFVNHISADVIPSWLERIPEGEVVRILERLAQDYTTHIVCGVGEIDDVGLRYNSAVFISPNGYEGTYRQPELTGKWIAWTNGYGVPEQNRVFVLKKREVDVGVAICAEITIPAIVGNFVPTVALMAVPANWYEDTRQSQAEQLEVFSTKYAVPLIMGNRGHEYFQGTPHENKYGAPKATRGNCAIIAVPGRKPIIKPETIVEVLTV